MCMLVRRQVEQVVVWCRGCTDTGTSPNKHTQKQIGKTVSEKKDEQRLQHARGQRLVFLLLRMLAAALEPAA
jgi:hypothetical protein